jgi:lipopolysaccharide/colanic/teichoic acid biosynthesis glycosyltransferase
MLLSLALVRAFAAAPINSCPCFCSHLCDVMLSPFLLLVFLVQKLKLVLLYLRMKRAGNTIYDFALTTLANEAFNMLALKGKVVLIENVASM